MAQRLVDDCCGGCQLGERHGSERKLVNGCDEAIRRCKGLAYIDLFFDPSRNALSSGNSPISPFPRSGKFLAVSHLYLTKFRQKARVLHSSTESKMQENSRRQTIQSL